MTQKRALIFGASGQAGRYLSRMLYGMGYQVFGTYYRHTNTEPILTSAICCDVCIRSDVRAALVISQPDVIYNFASEMFAPRSWELPVRYTETNFVSVVHMLELIQNLCPNARFFLAGSAEVFDLTQFPQTEKTPIKPRNPYGVAKAAAQDIIRLYREQKGLFACTGIFYNMESPLRQRSFFSRKVVTEVVRVKLALDKGETPEPIKLGKLHAVRDWGYTEEYMEAAYTMLHARIPDDYIVSTGRCFSCKEFVDEALEHVGLGWPKTREFLEFEKSDPDEVDRLCGLPLKIDNNLGWKAKKAMPELVKLMVEEELKQQLVSI